MTQKGIFAVTLGVSTVALAVTFTVKVLPLPSEIPDPSLLGEAEHALEIAEAYLDKHPTETNRVDVTTLTNGLTRPQILRKLVSTQRADGHWEGSNLTATVTEILRQLTY